MPKSKREGRIQRQIQVALSRGPIRLFRNNVGSFRTLDGMRVVRCGLAPGSADLIGFTRIKIRKQDIGKTLAVFTSIEVKRPRGRQGAAQRRWLALVDFAGGIGGFARSVEEAKDVIRDFCPPTS